VMGNSGHTSVFPHSDYYLRYLDIVTLFFLKQLWKEGGKEKRWCAGRTTVFQERRITLLNP
jgi:hypothetical protein